MAKKISRINVHSKWDEVFKGRPKSQLETALRMWLPTHRWFGGKARIDSERHRHRGGLDGAMASDSAQAKYLALAQVEYVDGEPETYLLPLGYATGEEADKLAAQSPSPSSAN